MEDLSKCLALPPAEIYYEFAELPADYESDIDNILNDDKDDLHCYEAALIEYFSKKQSQVSSLLVICSEKSPFRKKALALLPHALWGIATHSFSATYALYDQYIVWHEMLHLLGADDCYDIDKGDRGPNCGSPNCIMQYEALKINVGEWPFLCNNNISMIKRRLERWNNN